MVSLLKNWGITAVTTTSSCTRLLKNLLKSRLKSRTASGRTFNRKLFFFATPGLTGIRILCSSRDLTRIDCNMGDQAFHAPQHIAHLLPQQHQRCGQSYGVQSHQQLMMQQFLHQTNAPVYLSPPFFVTQFFLSMTSPNQPHATEFGVAFQLR